MGAPYGAEPFLSCNKLPLNFEYCTKVLAKHWQKLSRTYSQLSTLAMVLPHTATQSTPSNHNATLGPRKRRPTERVTENGDLLARKRAKTSQLATVEDVEDPVPPPLPQPCNPERILEAADGSDNDVELIDMPSLEAVDDEDDEEEEAESEAEDDDAELGT